MYSACPRTNEIFSSRHKSANQYHENMHSHDTTTCSRYGSMSFRNRPPSQGRLTCSRVCPSSSTKQTCIVLACKRRRSKIRAVVGRISSSVSWKKKRLIPQSVLVPHRPACDPSGIAQIYRTAASIPGGHDEYPVGQLDPQSLVVQSIGALIGSPSSIAGKLP